MLRELGLKIGVLLCLFPALMVGGLVYSNTTSDLSTVVGAVDCKGPCTEDPIKTRYECLDLTGPPCIPTGCASNEYHTVHCIEGLDAEKKCEKHWDTGADSWNRRWSSHQATGCNSAKQDTWNFDPCQWNVGDLTYKVTPCVTDPCTGAVQSRILVPGQFKCGP